MAETFKELGFSGYNRWSGVSDDEFLRELQGTQGYKRYDEMRRNSPIVGAMLLAIELSIRGVAWEFTSDQGENDQRLELLKASLDNLSFSWNDTVSEILTMLPFGWSYFEIVYERMGGDILWRKLAIRGQDTLDHWQWDEAGGLTGMWQRVPPAYTAIFLPIEKSLLFRTRVERNNPEGRSILRTAWIPYYFLKNIQQIEAIGIERDLAGMPVISLPENADTTESTTSDYGKASKLVRRIRNDEQAGVVIPFGWELELLSTGGSRQFDTDKVIGRYESRILMSTLSQFLMLGQAQVGTQALSKDQSSFFIMAVNSIADIISETMTKHAIPRLLELNGYDPDGITMTHSPAGDIDINMVADFLQKMGSFITWTPQDETWLRSISDLPEIDEAVIEGERARKEAQQAALADSLRQAQGKQAPPKGNEEEMGAVHLSAGNAPDDEERRRWERRLAALYKSYLAAEKKSIISAAKGLRNG